MAKRYDIGHFIIITCGFMAMSSGHVGADLPSTASTKKWEGTKPEINHACDTLPHKVTPDKTRVESSACPSTPGSQHKSTTGESTAHHSAHTIPKPIRIIHRTTAKVGRVVGHTTAKVSGAVCRTTRRVARFLNEL